MRTAAPPPIPAELPADGVVVPVWAYRSEAFAEDFDEQTLPGVNAPRERRGSGPLWPWALGVPMLVLAIGLVAAFHA